MIFGVRKWPALPTLVVLAAAAVMVMLGFWQLERLEEKEAQIALYAQAGLQTEPFEEWDGADPYVAYRRVNGQCVPIGDPQLVAGRNAQGEAGYVAAVPCRIFGFDWGGSYVVVLGWTDRLDAVAWTGGAYTGTLVPMNKASVVQPDEVHQGYDNFDQMDYHIVADPPLAGLAANARPDPNDLPNNHLAYAVQWFFFALTALVIYVLALKRRQREG